MCFPGWNTGHVLGYDLRTRILAAFGPVFRAYRLELKPAQMKLYSRLHSNLYTACIYYAGWYVRIGDINLAKVSISTKQFRSQFKAPVIVQLQQLDCIFCRHN